MVYSFASPRQVAGFATTGVESPVTSITESELANARADWGNALIDVSKAFDESGIGAAVAATNKALDALYGYELGPVLFKPTMAGGEQTFRTTRVGALAYFVGHNGDFPNDHGFGLRGWRQVESETAATFVQDDVAMWMGNVTFTDSSGGVTFVDKSWGYKKDAGGTLRIVLHHSSLPFEPS